MMEIILLFAKRLVLSVIGINDRKDKNEQFYVMGRRQEITA